MICPCGHPADDHPTGHCTATLPAVLAAELPEWACPCRHYAGARPQRRNAGGHHQRGRRRA